MGAQRSPHRQRVRAGGLGLIAACCAAAAAPYAASAASGPVPPRVAFEANRIDSPVTAALPDGRVLVGWFNGTNNGDTTLTMVRPAGGLLPSSPQVLRTGYSGETMSFTTGGPADHPVITAWQDGDSRTPFRVKLDGDLFTTQTPIFSGTFGTGRFPRYVRCPDGSVVFAYQTTAGPTSYYSSARQGTADGTLVGTTYVTASKPDYYQDPTVTCDQGVPLFSTAIAGDDQQGQVLPEHLRVQQIGAGGGVLLDTDSIAPHGNVSAPDARVAPDGRVWIMWTEFPSNPSGPPNTYLATRAPGAAGPATFSTTPFMTGDGTYPGPLFFDQAGNTHLLVQHESAMGQASYGIRTAPLGSATFGPEQELLPAGNHYVRLLLDHPDGNPRLLVISQDPAPTYANHYAVQGIPQAGSGSASTPLRFDGNDFAAATYLPSGDLFVVGTHEAATDRDQLVEGGLDTGAPPTIDAISVPGLAAGGETTPISLKAKDPLGLGSFAWTISGGSLAAPITLETQQATIPALGAGSYEIKARAVDRAGNATEITRTLRVLDPVAVTPGTPEFAQAVLQAGGTLTPADRAAPVLSKVSAQRGRKGKAKAKVTVKLRSSEAASLDVELIGTLRKGADKGTLILKSGSIKALPANATRSTTLKIPSSLARLVRNRLKVRLTVTDLAGNRTVKTVSVKVAKR